MFILQIKWAAYYATMCAVFALPLIWMDALPGKIVCFVFWGLLCFYFGRHEEGTKILWSMMLVSYGPLAFQLFDLKSAWWLIPFGILPTFAVVTLWQQIKLRASTELFLRSAATKSTVP